MGSNKSPALRLSHLDVRVDLLQHHPLRRELQQERLAAAPRHAAGDAGYPLGDALVALARTIRRALLADGRRHHLHHARPLLRADSLQEVAGPLPLHALLRQPLRQLAAAVHR